MAAGKYNTNQNYDDDIEFIKDSDPVQGDPAGTDPETTALTGPINVILQKIVSSLAYLKNAVDNFSISRMTDTVFGTGRTATQNEAEGGTAHGTGGPVLTPLRGRQATKSYIRSTDAQATETQRGTVQKATQAAVDTGTDAETVVTPQTLENKLNSFLEATVTTHENLATSGTYNTQTNNNGAVRIYRSGLVAIVQLSGQILGGGAGSASVTYDIPGGLTITEIFAFELPRFGYSIRITSNGSKFSITRPAGGTFTTGIVSKLILATVA